MDRQIGCKGVVVVATCLQCLQRPEQQWRSNRVHWLHQESVGRYSILASGPKRTTPMPVLKEKEGARKEGQTPLVCGVWVGKRQCLNRRVSAPCTCLRSNRMPWVLEKRPGDQQQRGLPDSGLAATAQGRAPAGRPAAAAGRGGAAAGRGGGAAAPAGPAAGAAVGAYNYYVLVQQGDSMTAFPADMVYSFKPVTK